MMHVHVKYRKICFNLYIANTANLLQSTVLLYYKGENDEQ